MLKSMALMVLCAVLAGCAGSMRVYVPASVPFSKPAIGERVEAAPGDPLLSQGSMRRYPALVLPQPVTVRVPVVDRQFLLPAGTYIKESENELADFFSWDEVTRPTGGGITSNGMTLKHLFVLKAPEKRALCAITYDLRLLCSEDAVYERTQADVADVSNFQRTLVYNGRVGNRIALGYREFSGSMARPAFNNQVDYDLTESKVLVYQGAQIEVLEATNQGIVYRVLRNFNAVR